MTMNIVKIIYINIYIYKKSEGGVVLNLKNVIKSYKMLTSSTHSKNIHIGEATLACHDFQNLF